MSEAEREEKVAEKIQSVKARSDVEKTKSGGSGTPAAGGTAADASKDKAATGGAATSPATKAGGAAGSKAGGETGGKKKWSLLIAEIKFQLSLYISNIFFSNSFKRSSLYNFKARFSFCFT